MSKPSIPKGTRDFLPVQKGRRNYLFNTIERVFQLHGFLPIETPAVEMLSSLMGKYGEEGDQLLFKLLKQGDKLVKSVANVSGEGEVKALGPALAEFGLRYDLTVPFARFVVQHQNDLAFPFRRYQIQPVWRGDRPQRGRYREFYQCDVDIVGSNGLGNEAELIEIIGEVFQALKMDGVTLALNNRKILAGIADANGVMDKFVDMTVAIDKLDKIGPEKVIEEMKSKGMTQEMGESLLAIFQFKGSNQEKLDFLKDKISSSEVGAKGLEEMAEVLALSEGVEGINVEVDFSLARGLSYYTGTIFEVKCDDFPSSICGGGRYDDLTGVFGLKDVSGVGISFGADRIYDVMEQRELFPTESNVQPTVFLPVFGEAEGKVAREIARELRAAGVRTQVFPEAAKMNKQMKYANRNEVPFVIMAGSEEVASGEFAVKDMTGGETTMVKRADIVGFFENKS